MFSARRCKPPQERSRLVLPILQLSPAVRQNRSSRAVRVPLVLDGRRRREPGGAAIRSKRVAIDWEIFSSLRHVI